MDNTLSKLTTPARCDVIGIETEQCGQPAHWLVNGYPTCDEDIREMANMNSDNEEFLKSALDEIASRKEINKP